MDSAPPNAATDQSVDGADPARVCARPDCSNPAPKGPTGRPRTYCSRSCRSKVDRAKAKAREEAAAEAAAPAGQEGTALGLHGHQRPLRLDQLVGVLAFLEGYPGVDLRSGREDSGRPGTSMADHLGSPERQISRRPAGKTAP